ncbi:FUSC family protein [Sphingomonas rubra]|uniref:FUSC family protein n=1 Tax=Sphingomonas rubra TaxID=634430 RepID=UPI001C434AFB|nr:FUSC family protein [Sphingomonas rubra]
MPRFLHSVVSISALRQAIRIAIACAVAFAAYKLLGLKQGYWAVFTVLIVMQGSIGGTLGAALDRLLGTLVGASLGAVGAWAHDGGVIATGGALVIVASIGGYLAVLRPQLKVAPVTASIMMLTMPANSPIATFVIDRVAEIMLGGLIGVAAMALILPARSGVLFTDRAADVLDTMDALVGDMANAIRSGTTLALGTTLVALRPALIGVEQALKDADREHAARLWRHAIPPAVPRTLWRMRSDIVLVARALNPSFSDLVRASLGEPAAALLLRLRDEIIACAVALRAKRRVERVDVAGARQVFATALTEFRVSPAGNALDLDTAGHVFGLSFALDELSRDLRDLADRIDEING